MTITGNMAQTGGGVDNYDTLTIQNSTISNNTATNGVGGGIENNGGTLVLVNTTVSGNTSSIGSGGGLDNYGNAQVTGGVFQGNMGVNAGAIDNEMYGTLTISGGSVFTGNTSAQDAGAISNLGTANITGALFAANQANGATGNGCGGAICNQGSLTVSESTFAANTVTGTGGAIDTLVGATLTLNDLTISGNTASVDASGLFIASDSTIPVINNTVIAGNTLVVSSKTSDCDGCAAEDGVGNVIGGTADLGPLAKNGGPTMTMMPLPGGNLVGLGTPSATTDTQDQRGFSRLSTTGAIDVGAVQSHYSSVSYSTQPSNTLVNQTITPAVAVQVIEVDGSSTNYPLGVPVTISLIPPEGVTATLGGTLTELPTVSGKVTAARFANLTVNATGGFQLFATDAMPGDSASADPTYNSTSTTFQVTAPVVVTLQWSPAPVAYGPLPASELNATATVDGAPGTGTFVYTFLPSGAPLTAGQIYPVATYKVQVAFTPTGSTTTYTLQTGLQITQATPVVTWPTPAAIYTSTPLSGTQLDATATGVTGSALPGAFVYTPPAGTTLTAGAHTLSTTFTPSDTVDYTTATKQVIIQVNAVTAASVVIQESASSITFGQSETLTAVVTGTDGNPFSGGTAAFTVNGTSIGSATVVSGTASVTDATPPGGTDTIGVTYTNTTTNQVLTATAGFTVAKATPKLTWATPAPIYTSTPLSATQLNATAAGVTGAALAGTFVYNPAAGTTLAAGPQTLSTTFTPTDTTDYTTNTAQVTIQVNTPTAATVVIQDSASPITFGQSETFTAVVTGTDGKPLSGGSAAFTVDGTVIGSASVTGGSASVTDANLTGGTHAVGVTYTNTSTNQTLTATASVTVDKATPKLTWATPAPIYTSTPLSGTQLDATATGVTGAALAGTFAYNPAPGTTLGAGVQTLTTTFTPTDTTDYTTNTAQVKIQVNAPTAATVVIQDSASPITFGQSETFTAVVTGTDGKPLSGGTAAFTVDGTAIGSAPVTDGTAAVTDASLTGGTHAVGVTYTNTSTNQTLTGTASVTVNKATPKLTWATPAPINAATPLSATQLDAAAQGVTGASLPGTFVYNPPAGTVLTEGPQVLSTTFSPSDATDYATSAAQVTIQVGYAPVAITSATPSSITVSSSPTSVVITGSGFTATSVAELNGSPVPSKLNTPTTITAAIPASTSPGTFQLTVYDSTSKFTSNALTLTITAPVADLSVTVPSEATSGEQPNIGLVLNAPYPAVLTGSMTLAFSPSGSNGVDDPAVQFSTGGRTLAFTVPAGSTTTPQVALQTGTVAGTITVTLSLTADGVDVTPAGVSPITLAIAPAAPVITNITFTNSSSGAITVVVSGYSNTRDMSSASFIFTGTGSNSLASPTVSVPVTSLFTPWYTSSSSDAYGSEFTYTQNFQLSRPDSGLTGVSVTLTNSIGTSGSVNSQ
jgi:hypothetical protein